jgi:hypothetical protein
VNARKTLSLAFACAALAVVIGVLPVSASSPFVSSLTSVVCTTSGGQNGVGFTRGHVFMEEVGKSGTNYLRFIVRLQRLEGSTWVTERVKGFHTATFVNNNITSFTQKTVRFDFTGADTHHKDRLQVRYEWWASRAGPDKLLHVTTRNSTRSC